MFGRKEQYEIAAYRGFGNRQKLVVKGRVLRDKGILAGAETDGSWRNLVNMLRRFESDEFPVARVEIQWREAIQQATADAEGYFESWMPIHTELPEKSIWEPVEIRLLHPEPESPIKSTAFVLIPSKQAKFGVVSDLDDTVVQTGATSYLRMIKTILLANARTRLPFEGVAGFYKALQQGTSEEVLNPLFYVSSSPWNLYDLIAEFLEYQKIPAGPVMLRDWGVNTRTALPTHHKTHKLTMVKGFLDLYPDLPFILIGDSGQDDPEIYSELAIQNPGRILAIYIRDVSKANQRLDKILLLSKTITAAGTTFLLTPDTRSAAKHASDHGWISPESLPGL